MPREDDLRLEDSLQATAKIADFLERDIDFFEDEMLQDAVCDFRSGESFVRRI